MTLTFPTSSLWWLHLSDSLLPLELAPTFARVHPEGSDTWSSASGLNLTIHHPCMYVCMCVSCIKCIDNSFEYTTLVCMYVCMCFFLYRGIFMHIFVRGDVCMYVYRYMYIYMYVIYVSIHTCIQANTPYGHFCSALRLSLSVSFGPWHWYTYRHRHTQTHTCMHKHTCIHIHTLYSLVLCTQVIPVFMIHTHANSDIHTHTYTTLTCALHSSHPWVHHTLSDSYSPQEQSEKPTEACIPPWPSPSNILRPWQAGASPWYSIAEASDLAELARPQATRPHHTSSSCWAQIWNLTILGAPPRQKCQLVRAGELLHRHRLDRRLATQDATANVLAAVKLCNVRAC